MENRIHGDYLRQGPFSDPGKYRPLLAGMVRETGADPRALAERIRGLMIHVFWRKAYGLEEDRERSLAETNLRSMPEKLALIAEAQESLGRPASSAEPLPPGKKLIGNCRDYSLFFAALLREAGIPARARCGFGMYFMPNHGEDHWVVERWDEGRGNWVISDPQLDGVMIEKIGIAFDPMDLPDGAFLSGGEAWLACRRGEDPKRYGIFDLCGWDFVKGDMVRDFLSLSGFELLPWDLWGAMMQGHSELGEAELAILDSAAARAPMRAGLGRTEAERLCADRRFALPRRISSFPKGGLEEVDLGPILGLDWPHGSSGEGGREAGA
jgi:hypothetical protein